MINKIIKLLYKEPNKELAQFFLLKLDSLSDEDLLDLYFLLTSDDKNKILQFVQNNTEKLQNQFFELKQLGLNARKDTLQYSEKLERINASNVADSLFNNM